MNKKEFPIDSNWYVLAVRGMSREYVLKLCHRKDDIFRIFSIDVVPYLGLICVHKQNAKIGKGIINVPPHVEEGIETVVRQLMFDRKYDFVHNVWKLIFSRQVQ